MDKIEFVHGGPEFDAKYPDGIPTQMEIELKSGQVFDSGLVMYPGGHARCKDIPEKEVLRHKFKTLGKLALDASELGRFQSTLASLDIMDNEALQEIYDCYIRFSDEPY